MPILVRRLGFATKDRGIYKHPPKRRSTSSPRNSVDRLPKMGNYNNHNHSSDTERSATCLALRLSA